MASVYILYSKKLDRFYTGSCLEFHFRFEDHVRKAYSGELTFTSNSDDWQLFFLLLGLSYSQARSIEKHIKKMKSRAYIQNLLKYSDMLRRQFAAIPTSVWGESAVSSEAFTLMYPSTCTVTSQTFNLRQVNSYLQSPPQ